MENKKSQAIAGVSQPFRVMILGEGDPKSDGFLKAFKGPSLELVQDQAQVVLVHQKWSDETATKLLSHKHSSTWLNLDFQTPESIDAFTRFSVSDTRDYVIFSGQSDPATSRLFLSESQEGLQKSSLLGLCDFTSLSKPLLYSSRITSFDQLGSRSDYLLKNMFSKLKFDAFSIFQMLGTLFEITRKLAAKTPGANKIISCYAFQLSEKEITVSFQIPRSIPAVKAPFFEAVTQTLSSFSQINALLSSASFIENDAFWEAGFIFNIDAKTPRKTTIAVRSVSTAHHSLMTELLQKQAIRMQPFPELTSPKDEAKQTVSEIAVTNTIPAQFKSFLRFKDDATFLRFLRSTDPIAMDGNTRRRLYDRILSETQKINNQELRAVLLESFIRYLHTGKG